MTFLITLNLTHLYSQMNKPIGPAQHKTYYTKAGFSILTECRTRRGGRCCVYVMVEKHHRQSRYNVESTLTPRDRTRLSPSRREALFSFPSSPPANSFPCCRTRLNSPSLCCCHHTIPTPTLSHFFTLLLEKFLRIRTWCIFIYKTNCYIVPILY